MWMTVNNEDDVDDVTILEMKIVCGSCGVGDGMVMAAVSRR